MIVKSASEEQFKQAKAGMQSTATIQPPRVSPIAKYSSQKQSSADVSRTAPMFNDPRYTSSTLAVPTDERTLHGLYRFFAETDPIIGAGLQIHTELPLSAARLGQCEDTGVQQHFEEMWERINGYKFLTDAVLEYFEIGNVIPFGAFNSADYMWEQFAILNPDYVKIESTWVNQRPLIKLIPEEGLKKIVRTQSPAYLYNQIPKEVVQHVLANQEIPLDPNNTFHIAHAKRPYEVKGRSLIKRVLKTLMLEDRYNQANFAIAHRHAVPMTVVKVGDPASNWLPTTEDLEDVREMMANFELDPNFSLIWHYGIDIQHYGSNGKTLPIGPELDRLYRLKFIGMGIHEQLLSGQGGSYAQAYVSMEVQRQRYLSLQLKLENLIHIGMFKPIADLCGFYKIRQAVSSSSGVSKTKYGASDDKAGSELKQFTSVRDEQDNTAFKEFMLRKTAESNKSIKEYIYPRMDWGSMNAANDESMKNYVKWLADKRPYLVDDATLARLAKLDRDDQTKAYVSDLKRKKGLIDDINAAGLGDLADKSIMDLIKDGTQPSGSSPMDFGDLGGGMPPNIDMPTPTGMEGPPDSASASEPPTGMDGLAALEYGLKKESNLDNLQYKAEVSSLRRANATGKLVV